MTERSQMHQSSFNDMPIHKFIPMEKFDLIHPNEVRILYYQSPSQFYVYLREKINSHAQFQVELQRAMENYRSVSTTPQYQRYQPVVAQDNHAIWHRAMILNFNCNSNVIGVYFVDVGQEENISITNIRPLPPEFNRQPAFAIPCRLYEIYPLNSTNQSSWKLDDPVHDEFNRLMANNALCKVCDIKEQICYDVAIEIPKVGDLGTYLCEKKLVSSSNMRTTVQNTNQTFGRIPPGFADIQTRVLQKPVVQQSPSTPTSTESSSDISTLPPQDGNYIITQVYSAIEFYGHSQGREKELDAFHKHLETIYNNNTNDQSLSVHFLMEGVSCVIQQGEKYHRVVIKHRESESRVLVKLVDRGDEILVDTSELLQLEKKYSSIPAFAQPFRLYNYDETHSTANITRKLKRLILNQRVHITQHPSIINGFYPVEVKLSDNQSVNQILLSNDAIPVIPPPVRPVEVPAVQSQRTNEDLPAPQKLLTAPPPTITNRFTPNEQTSRFSRPQQQEEEPKLVPNGHQPLMPELNRPYSRGFSTERNGNNNRGGRNSEENGGQRPGGFGSNRGGRSDRNNEENDGQRTGGFASSRGSRSGFTDRGSRTGFGGDRNNDEDGGQRTGGFGSNRGSGGFADRGGRSGFGGDRNNDEDGGKRTGGFGSNRGSGGFADRGGRSGFGGDRNNDEDGGQRTGGFGSNRGSGGFADRGGRNGFDGDRNNNENSGQRTGGFNTNRGARNGDFQDRNNRFRNNQDEDNNENNGTQRFGNRGGFNGERRDRNGGGGGGGFQSNYDREDGGNNVRRGGFGDRGGGPRGGRGGFGDRGGGGRGGFSDRGHRGGGGGFRDRNENGFRSPDDTNEPLKTFSGWPNVKPTPVRFESGDKFIENEIPAEAFQFVISHIEKSNDFFIQLCSKENELSELTETLQKEYKDAPELSFSSIKINQACLAKSSDDCWYRAVILTTDIIKLKVRFIDFGDTIDLETKTIRQLAKKFCSTPPYAYHCTLNNVRSNENINTNEIIEKCAGQQFHGKIEKKTSDEKYLLESDNFEQLMIDIKAIQKNLPCVIVYIDSDKHQFYIQIDPETMEKIDNEVTTDIDLPSEEIQVNSMVISTFEDAPYRAIIQSDLGDNVSVYFVDYGNTNICSKDLLKKCPEELKTYPYQAKRCQLFDISSNDLEQAFKQLDVYTESDQVTYSIVNQTDDLLNVLLYTNGECFNEKFSNETSLDLDDQSSTTTATTVKEQERPISASGKRNNEAILSPTGNLINTSMNTKRQKSESETEVNSTKYREGFLTYIDKNQPFVYLQLIPESESSLVRINELIDTVVREDKHNSSYEIGDYVIAQFTEDNDYYRARIESYSSSTELYTVYFLDYGNTDENVRQDHLYSYSMELKDIPTQAYRYTLDQITSQRWINIVRPVLEEKLNQTIEFYFTDENKSSIHLKFENENQIYSQPKTFTANISGTNQDCFYIHVLPDADTLICEMDELLQGHPKEHSNQWNINDLCIVFNSEENQYFRGKILSIDNEKYDVQCIDYGNILSNITNEHLYLLTNDDLIKQNPIARQCRLYGVDDKDQSKAIDEIIRNINSDERVTITVDNDQNDQCMFVMLFRENNEIINDRFIKQETNIKDAMSTSSSDSAIAADNDTSNEQQVTSPIGIPQAESTHQYGDTTNLTTNQTIDFGENDPSSSSNTTIRDETENEN